MLFIVAYLPLLRAIACRCVQIHSDDLLIFRFKCYFKLKPKNRKIEKVEKAKNKEKEMKTSHSNNNNKYVHIDFNSASSPTSAGKTQSE